MSDGTRQALHSGGCQCGAVRYALYAPPHDVHLCHCRMCQKAVGGPFAALAPVRHADFAWTRGTPATFRSSTLAFRDYCRNCGTPLTFRYAGGDWINVTLGSLDRPADVPPIRLYGVESRLPWLAGIADLPAEITDANMPADRKAVRRSFQHPDHDTGPEWEPRE